MDICYIFALRKLFGNRARFFVSTRIQQHSKIDYKKAEGYLTRTSAEAWAWWYWAFLGYIAVPV